MDQFFLIYGPSAKCTSHKSKQKIRSSITYSTKKKVCKISVISLGSIGGGRIKWKQKFLNLAGCTLQYDPLNWSLIVHVLIERFLFPLNCTELLNGRIVTHHLQSSVTCTTKHIEFEYLDCTRWVIFQWDFQSQFLYLPHLFLEANFFSVCVPTSCFPAIV